MGIWPFGHGGEPLGHGMEPLGHGMEPLGHGMEPVDWKLGDVAGCYKTVCLPLMQRKRCVPR